MDVEWAVDGMTNEFLLCRLRPETIHSTERSFDTHGIRNAAYTRQTQILKGIAVGDQIGYAVK